MPAVVGTAAAIATAAASEVCVAVAAAAAAVVVGLARDECQKREKEPGTDSKLRPDMDAVVVGDDDVVVVVVEDAVAAAVGTAAGAAGSVAELAVVAAAAVGEAPNRDTLVCNSRARSVGRTQCTRKKNRGNKEPAAAAAAAAAAVHVLVPVVTVAVPEKVPGIVPAEYWGTAAAAAPIPVTQLCPTPAFGGSTVLVNGSALRSSEWKREQGQAAGRVTAWAAAAEPRPPPRKAVPTYHVMRNRLGWWFS